ncbi:MAG: 5-dehydro-2-deoxygluconokinase [Clostridia bacterium]|nr:5-dehydro-2-deoxygluconokinase [Clostridia bacterium]MBQ6722658.1 5-dehydro-2-deoxygluconokinase [Clostridia bacterium]
MIFFDLSKPLRIVLVGRVAIDFNPTDYNRPLNESSNFNKYLGGSPANIAVGMARLGDRVGFLGRVSDDQFGTYVTDYFRNEGIDVSHIRRCEHGEKLGLTFTEMLSPTESSILMYREGVADLQLAPEDIDEAYIASASCLLISGTALCCSPTREASLKALAFALRNQVPVVFDADYRAYTWKGFDEIAIYTSLVAEKADIIMGSREEFDLMERLLGLDGSDAASAAYWLGKKAQICVIKHGKSGSDAYSRDQGCWNVKPFPVTALKGFGGGDGYASSFLHALMAGRPLEDALERGSASAAMLVASHACSKDMPAEDALNAFIQEKKAACGSVVTPL